MEILEHKQKRKNEQAIYEVRCSCGCRFRFTSDDMCERVKGIGEAYNGLVGKVKCPECGDKITVHSNDRVN